MSEKQIESTLRWVVIVFYVVGMFTWLGAWLYFSLVALVSKYPLIIIPFVGFYVVMCLNLLLWLSTDTYSDFDTEIDRIEEVETYAYYLVSTAIGTLIIASSIIRIGGVSSLPTEFLFFEAGALIFSVVGVLALYWIPGDRPAWLSALRHLKTIFFTYALFIFLSGLLILVSWMNIIIQG